MNNNLEKSMFDVFDKLFQQNKQGQYFFTGAMTNPDHQRELMQLIENSSFTTEVIKNLPYPSKEMLVKAIETNTESFCWMKNPSEEIQLLAVSYDGRIIRYISNPSYAVIIQALKQNGAALANVKDPTEEMKIIAVKSNSTAYLMIENPSEEVSLEFVKKYTDNIKKMRNPSLAIQFYLLDTIEFKREPKKYIQTLINCLDSDPRILLEILKISNPRQKKAIKKHKDYKSLAEYLLINMQK